MSKPRLAGGLVLSITLGVVNGSARAGLVVPFTEDFNTGNADWADPFGAPADWVADGGPDGLGDAYLSTDFAFADSGPFGAVLFRAQDEFNSSDGKFFGNWITGGVDEVTFRIRHNAPVPVQVFGRFSSPNNIPAAAGLVFEPVLPNVWTEVSIEISPDSPQLVFENGDFESVFSDVGHLQVGMIPPMGFENDPTPYTWDVDKVGIVPAPSAMAALGMALAGWRRRRR